MRLTRFLFALVLLAMAVPAVAQDYEASTFRGLALREIGPALTSGRIADLAVNPQDHSEYYVAVASGGVWKTTNNGVTYRPIFDSQGSYSIGVVTLDPNNPHVVWVGTGENNAQRSVAYGDGVYKSEDGGQSWEMVGLENSEHIGAIVVDPRDSDVVYVAAQGPLWSAGGDRGLYKTTDGGDTWNKVLDISEHTGVTDLVMDPRDPDVLIAASWQRRRHVWTLVSGGPESALYKSTDGGQTWDRLSRGLPGGDVGRYGLCMSPVDPDYVYAVVEAKGDAGGFFRSTDRGASWRKVNSWTSRGNYYQELICDPADRDRVFAMDTYTRITTDGGNTINRFPNPNRHVDDHALWIDPTDTEHMIIGGDGGVYETFDDGATWDFKENLPITQFYKVVVDNDYPFYNVYGGTQDNWSLGGPSRTLAEDGISNDDWIVTNGGDGFESAVDPTDPNIVYAQSQYGNLVRFDRASGEATYIQPQPVEEGEALRWNWDAPLLISPHSHTRLYFAANKLYRSDDRGDSWTAISGDLSRQIDRNTLPVMGRVWGPDAVGKNASTSIYGNIVALSESPVQEDLIYVGTDDGLIQMTENAGGEWTRYDDFPGVPDRTYVNMVLASAHDANTVYAAFNNHKMGDFEPYILKSENRGRRWQEISGDLPERGSVYAIAEDPVDPDLLFAGTEFGVFFTKDGGEHWTQLGGGIPTIAVRDLAIQEREVDLALATFGRGFWILDDYTPLRHVAPEVLEEDAHIFPIRDALLYLERERGREYQGATYYWADNPPFGAVITYHLKDGIRTREQLRQAAEREAREAGEPVDYPTFEEMRAEDREEEPYLVFTITKENGEVVRRLTARPGSGLNRIAWDLRYTSKTPVEVGADFDPFDDAPAGPLVAPGTYQVSLAKVVDGVPTELTGPVSFEVVPLHNATLATDDRDALVAFQLEADAIMAQVREAGSELEEIEERLARVREVVKRDSEVPLEVLVEARDLQAEVHDLRQRLEGDRSVARRQFETPPSISERVGKVMWSSYGATAAPGGQQREQLRMAEEALLELMPQIDDLMERVEALEERIEG
jgi:photosystem II stability/assembly factor-like uncharacterized protein